jgi:ABC-type transport system involved in multi-copper enzyme maturation permease subunit
MNRAIRAEFLKLKGSRTLLWTAIVIVAYAILTVVLNVVLLRDPKMVATLGTASGAFKTALDQGFYVLNWKNQLRVGVQGISGTYGVLLFSFVAAYVFGREYKQHTSKNMLTLPVRREYVVAAKLVVVAVWVVALALLSLVLQSIGLAALSTPGFAWRHVWGALADSMAVTLLIFLTLPLVGWLSVIARGYLHGMLMAFAATLVGNGIATSKVSPYFPWNMPIHLVGASWMPVATVHLVPASWAIAAAVFAVGVLLVVRRVDLADDVS